MDLPLRYDITIPQRATFRERIQLPIDCSDREVVAQVWHARNGKRVEKMLDLQIDWMARSTPIEVTLDDGTTAVVTYADFYLTCDWSVTAGVTRQGIWDLLVVNGPSHADSGARHYWLEGLADFNAGMTEAEP